MWNFAGRQNDIQGHGEVTNGNWISGIPFIDNGRLGNEDILPDYLANNKAKNKYFLLPLLLGLVGVVTQFRKDRKGIWIVGLLFFFTGIAIVIYLNQYPHQPRERDYAYAGSFYAFAIWIGLGVAGLINLIRKAMPEIIAGAIITLAALILVPGIMAVENWDDHDRSERYTALDFAKNYLNSCAPNAILFTNGDNDTFPLWYAQEVEGIRTDVRVVNLSLLNTDWYIDQMKRKAYDSEPVPFSLTHDQYVQGTRDYLPIQKKFNYFIDIDKVMDFVASDDDRTKYSVRGSNEKLNYLPSNKIKIPVDSAKLVSNGTIHPDRADEIPPYIEWTINKSYILKSDLMILDLLATNNWERPVYFAITVGTSSYMNLQKYLQLEGLAYRVVPIPDKRKDSYMIGHIQADIMYDNMMNKFSWGGIDNPDVYLDENIIRMTMNFRSNFARLADALLMEGKKDSSIAVLDHCLEIMPDSLVPYNYFNLSLADVYYKAEEFDKANAIVQILQKRTESELDYYLSLDKEYAATIAEDKIRSWSVYREIGRLLTVYKQDELAKSMEDKFAEYYQKMVASTPK
ncbi:MAG: hypothetical protein C0594_02410 [Marinilabiliales bacterium]|nr:MAG: hypothetical protein C0594_02410 [Marinilabiliales bacterium]